MEIALCAFIGTEINFRKEKLIATGIIRIWFWLMPSNKTTRIGILLELAEKDHELFQLHEKN